ncbi:hypothetical protein D3C76_1187830 [compost metagenome]
MEKAPAFFDHRKLILFVVLGRLAARQMAGQTLHRRIDAAGGEPGQHRCQHKRADADHEDELGNEHDRPCNTGYR